jgi:Outer membrane protein beta-barrel domain
MKKAVLASAALLVIMGLVAAPAAAAGKWNFGLKAGASFSNVAWSDDDGSEKMLIQPTFGGFVVFNLSPTLAIQPEVNYLVTGESWSYTEGTISEKFTYLQIPILLKIKLMKEGKFIPVVFVGPAVSFLLSMTEGGDSYKEFFDDTDFGLDFGLGGEMTAGKMKVVFDARYYLGLSNAYNPPVVLLEVSPSDFSMKNRAFSLTVGLLF